MKKVFFFIIALFMLMTSCEENLIMQSNQETRNSSGISTRGDTENVCVASWNTQLLDVGDIFGDPQCEGAECDARAEKICEQVSNLLDPSPDIVNFQEVFEADAAQALIACMTANGYPYNTGFDPNQNGTDCFSNTDIIIFSIAQSESEGSGLITFSKYPIISTVSEDFEDCNGCIGEANDCLAEKGMVLTEIEVSPGCTIFNFNTHLDAGDSNEDAATRAKQLEQMKNFLKNNVPDGSPLLVSGDFNIKRNSSEYHKLVTALGSAKNTALMAGTKDGITSPASEDDPASTLDYIFGQGINSATYKVYYQETKCWWEYREVIKTPKGPKEFGDYDIWDLDPNGEIDWDNLEASDFIISVTTHRYYDEADIPAEHLNKVTKICKSVEKHSEKVGKKCGWTFTFNISIIDEID